MTTKKGLFDVIGDLSYQKKHLINMSEVSESEYVPYMTNKAFSFHIDSLFYANDMNIYSDLDKAIQYDYYFHSLSKKKRYSKWFKPDNEERVLKIQQFFECNKDVAIEYMNILGKEEIDSIVEKMKSTGGRIK